MASEIRRFFNERREEIQTYVDFLITLEAAAKNGTPRFKSTDESVTTEQVKILYSSLFLQLYNLTEATVSRCLDSVVSAVVADSAMPLDLNAKLRQEWVRAIARTHTELNPSNRLNAAIEMCEHLLNGIPVKEFKIELGGGGNWDDSSMESMWARIGCDIRYSKTVSTAAKRPFLDELGAFRIVKKHRNDLAHGSVSFVECSDNITVSQLQELTSAVFDYLDETVSGFETFINKGYMAVAASPAA